MKQKKIYFPIFGSGTGHANRTTLVVNSLENNYKCSFSSFKDGYEFLIAKGFECKRIPALDIWWNKDGTASTMKTIMKSPILMGVFLHHLKNEFQLISKQKPDLVFSDSRLSPLLCAKQLKIPSIVILNQIKLLVEIRNTRRKNFERINGEILGHFWKSANEILIPDLPPPHTICIENINDINSIQNKIQYIGFISKEIDNRKVKIIKKKLNLDKKKHTIYVQISGPQQSRLHIYKKVLKQIKQIKKDYNIIISKGIPNGNNIPKKINDTIVFEWCSWKEMFEISDCLVIRGGHSSIGDALTCGKPSIIIPIKKQSEQIQNAKRIDELGLGIYMEEDEDNSLVDNINKIINEDKFNKTAKNYRDLTKKYNGIQMCKNKIIEYTK